MGSPHFEPVEHPFDKIKPDRSFTTEGETNPQSKAIIRAVLGATGCDEAQGCLPGRPAQLSRIVASGQITSATKALARMEGVKRSAA